MKIHEKYIKRCIEIAKNGLGSTYPNPLVGSVIVSEDTIIGEGWHRKAGLPHAEVLAVKSVADKRRLENATLYVNLEPCSHHGRTPPCTELIIASGIKKVVLGTADPFVRVAGSGIKQLREAGCTVTEGILADDCQELNKRFFTFHTKKRPYIILKWAESADGFLGSGRLPGRAKEAKPEWISNQYSRQRVHRWRSQEQAILVGAHTVVQDNPKLNVRDWQGESPVRIVLDKRLTIKGDYAVWDGSVKTLCITDRQPPIPEVERTGYEPIDFSRNVAQQIAAVLYRHELQSVIVEGGAKTLQLFIDEGLWDEARVFTGNKRLKKGIKAPVFPYFPVDEENITSDVLRIYRNN